MKEINLIYNEKTKFFWNKGSRNFYGNRRDKIGLAKDLIYMKNIKLSKKDLEWLDIDGKDLYQLNRVCDDEWAKLLERKGWKWRILI